MTRRKNRRSRREPDTPSPSDASHSGAFWWRRWSVLVAGAICIAAIAACAVVFLFPGEDETDRLRAAVAETASRASPNIAKLLNEAGDVAAELLDRFPYSADALAVAAGFYKRLGRMEDAIRCWQECMEMDPALASACHAAIAEIALEKGEQAKAALHFRKAMQQDPESPTHPVQLAEALMHQAKLEEAVSVLEKNRKLRPRSMPTFALLGQAYLQLGEHEKARQFLEMAIQLGPDYTNAYYGLSRACAQLGDKEKSKEYLDKFKALQAKDEQRHRDSLKKSEDTAEFRRAVAQVHTAAGKIYIACGEVRTGEEHLLRAASLAPDRVDCRSLLAWLYEKQGRTAEALRTLETIGTMAPNDVAAQLSIADAYVRLDRFSKAEAAYRRAAELAPNQAGGYAALASFYLQAGRNLDEAKTLASKAAQMEPVAKHYFLLSRACLSTGDRTEARSAIEQAVALDSDNAQYQDWYEKIRKTE